MSRQKVFLSSRRRHTRFDCDWSSDVCSSDLERLGAGWLAPVAAIVAILLVLGNLGGVGAWLAGSARLPYVAGVDGAVPAAVGRVPPRGETPHVGLLGQGAVAAGFVIPGPVGA